MKAIIALVLLGLTGCVSPKTLRPEDIARINRTHVRAYLPQERLQVQISGGSSGAGAGPVLGLLFLGAELADQAIRAKQAEARAEQIRSVTRDVDIPDLYWQDISNVIATNSWLKLGKFETFATAPKPPTKEELTNGAVLNIETEYLLPPDGNRLLIITTLGLYLGGESTEIAAANEMISVSNDVGTPTIKQEAAMGLWLTNNGAAFREAVSQGMQAQARLIYYALEDMGGITNARARRAEIQSRPLPYRNNGSGLNPFMFTPATVVEETQERFIVKGVTGAFFSLPRQRVCFTYDMEK